MAARILYGLLAILIFGLIIGLHEFGHFIAARLSGVKVNEFSIGMGPAIFTKQGKETLYALRVVPLGGYCAMEGETEDSGDERGFMRQSLLKKIAILVAGPLMNLVTGFAIVLILFAGYGAVFFQDSIVGFAEGFPLEGENGLMVGDVFYSIDGYRTYTSGDASTFLSYHRGDTIDMVVLRDGKKIVLEDFPLTRGTYKSMDGEEYTGFGIFITRTPLPTTPLSILQSSVNTVLGFIQLVRFSLAQLFTGGAGVDDFTGAVGMTATMAEIGATAESTGSALANIFYFAALISVNLFVMNLLPIPALDGGRFFVLLIDALVFLIIRRHIPDEWQERLVTICFILLLVLMALIMFQDVVKIATGTLIPDA